MTGHSITPHEPGRLYDCPACESKCHCKAGETECIFSGTHSGLAAPDDMSAVMAECRAAQSEEREISDGCARTIASLYATWADGAFTTTGAIDNPDRVWWSLFGGPDHNGVSFYDGMGPARLLADMLGTYLVRAGRRGPVPGWSHVWAR